MGTNNFYNKNANKYFAVLMDYEDIIFDEDGNETNETEYVSCDEFDYENFYEELNSFLTENKTYHKKYGFNQSNNRNFEGEIIGSLVQYKIFADCEIKIVLTSILRSGYYEGANLDWELTIFFNGNENDNIDYSDFEYNTDLNKGICSILANKANNWIDKTKDIMINELETVYEQISNPLIKIAQFSNGEAIYQSVK